jgi:hypothetical protein
MGTVIFLPARAREPERRRFRPQLHLRRREQQPVTVGDLVALAEWRSRRSPRRGQLTPQPPHDGDAA